LKIQLASDLHLESHPHFSLRPAPGADLLVLAGDIGSYQQGSLLSSLQIADFGLARFSPLPPDLGGAGWPTPVIFVAGNHEYDGQDFAATQSRLREACARLGITMLEQDTLEMGGVRFVGCTLWADFDALAAQAGDSLTPAKKLLAREKAFRAANFYLKKNHPLRNGMAMLAPELRAESIKNQAWLHEILAAKFDGPKVVITHFAPSLRSADPRYGLVPGTAGFCNSLDDLLSSARLWLHGHLHCPADYVIDNCRVAANPLGYAYKGEQATFRQQGCFTVKP
jgi:predicted phosphodiesterase